MRKELRYYILSASVIFLFFVILTRIIPISPDEYFYATTSQAIAAAWKGKLALHSINTEHTALLSIFAAFLINIFHLKSVYFLRLISAFLATLIIFIYLAIFRTVFNKKESIFALLLLVLIPGFIFSASKFYLEIPISFCTGLLFLSLIKNKPTWLNGLLLALVLLTKEYYFFLIAPMVIFYYLFKRFTQIKSQNFLKLIILFLIDTILLILPSLLISALFIDFAFGPYPRMLENSWFELLPNVFLYFNKIFYHFYNNYIIHFFKISPSVTTSDTINPIINETILNTPVGSTIVSPDILVAGDSAQLKVSILDKLWLIYRYNFYENEVNFSILVLAAFGFVENIINLFRNKFLINFEKNKTNLLFFLFSIPFLLLNYREAINLHGFRINVPGTFILIYFSYTALKSFATQRSSRLKKVVFATISFALIATYFSQESVLIFNNQIKSSTFGALIFCLKPYVFVLLFIALVFTILKNRIKSLYIISLLLLFLHIIPFAIEKKLEDDSSGNDYELSYATNDLHNIFDSQNLVYGNTNCYKTYYYADWIESPTTDINPHYRLLEPKYPILCNRYTTIEELKAQITYNKTFYLLFINDGSIDKQTFDQLLINYPNNLKIINNQYKNDRLLWSIYKFTP